MPQTKKEMSETSPENAISKKRTTAAERKQFMEKYEQQKRKATKSNQTSSGRNQNGSANNN